MTENEVQQQLNTEHEKFMHSSYKGKVPVPENILELFKKSILSLPPFFHKVNFYKVKSIAEKTIEQLTVSDINDIIKVIINTPLERLYYADTDNGIFFPIVNEVIKFDKFVLCFNETIEEFKKRQEMRKVNLINLSKPIISGNNGMRITN